MQIRKSVCSAINQEKSASVDENKKIPENQFGQKHKEKSLNHLFYFWQSKAEKTPPP